MEGVDDGDIFKDDVIHGGAIGLVADFHALGEVIPDGDVMDVDATGGA